MPIKDIRYINIINYGKTKLIYKHIIKKIARDYNNKIEISYIYIV